jgi:Nitrile hydratase, alpha chain
MTEASGGGSRAEMERRLIERSLEDQSFRQRLLDDPKGTIEHELGTQLPESIEVRVVEESADTIYLVLPSVSPTGQGSELSDQELDAVSGGTGNEPCMTPPPQQYTGALSNDPACS